MDNKKAFYLSAFIAVGFYIFLIFSFLFYLQVNDVKKIDSMVKTTVLQLDVVLESPKEPEKKIEIQSKINKQKSESIVKKSASSSVKQKTNLKSLFANVKTKSAQVVKKRVMNVKKNSISSRFKSKFEKVKKKDALSIKDFETNKKSNFNNIISSESKNENDPYYSKIYQILSSRWRPTIFLNNLKAKVLITILSNGKFNYKFVQYSDNMGFDEQLKLFLNSQTIESYPVNPNKRSTSIEIIFQSKGE
ncbi:MAG: TonB C-terminal domain-containing protein [Campylobacterota bacterium]|nr:TonB C-terminal domain-containing protein [Campylobacterota bacterium]